MAMNKKQVLISVVASALCFLAALMVMPYLVHWVRPYGELEGRHITGQFLIVLESEGRTATWPLEKNGQCFPSGKVAGSTGGKDRPVGAGSDYVYSSSADGNGAVVTILKAPLKDFQYKADRNCVVALREKTSPGIDILWGSILALALGIFVFKLTSGIPWGIGQSGLSTSDRT
jgi:hypothetical protein